MDGSSIDFVVIPVIVVPLLALWIIGMYYADSHLRWRTGPSGGPSAVSAGEVAATPVRVTVPAQAQAQAQATAPAPAQVRVPPQATAPVQGSVLANDRGPAGD
jgi:hypothetical protein